jgi:hypothetical protein
MEEKFTHKSMHVLLHRMLLHEAQSGQNVHLYKEALELIGDKLGPPEKLRDQAWMDRVQEQNDKALEKLEVSVDEKIILPTLYQEHPIYPSLRLFLCAARPLPT